MSSQKKSNFLGSLHMMDFFTGKIRDLGSNFSHETPKVAAGDLADKGSFFFLNFVNGNKK